MLRGLIPLVMIAGCTSYHPYGRYPGAQTYPQYYGNGYNQPVPNGTMMPNNATLGTPGAINGTPGPGATGAPGATNGPAAAQPIPKTQAKREEVAPFGSEKPVPNYKDPVKVDGGPMKSDFGNGSTAPPAKQPDGNVSPFGSGAATGTPSDNRVQLAGSQQFAGTQPSTAGQPGNGDSRFAAPKTIDTPSNAQPIGSAAPGQPTPDPYGYDAKNYTWLRGKVDYDQGSKSWQIIYSLDGKDPYGGALTLADHPRLKSFRNDDVAYIEGELDTSAGPGKPRYKILRVDHPLHPDPKVQAAKIGAAGTFEPGSAKSSSTTGVGPDSGTAPAVPFSAKKSPF